MSAALPANWQCFVVNLDRSPERMSRISAQLNGLCLRFERFAAIDGHTLDLDSTPQFCRRGYEKRHGKLPAPGELGCFLSHIALLRRFLATKNEFCLVLEDDAIISPEIADVLVGLTWSSGSWDVALLYGNHAGMPQTLRRIDHKHRIVGFLSRQTGTVCYAINRRGAEAYIRHLLPMTLPIDQDFDRAWHFEIKFRGVMPFPVTTGAHPSDIGATGRKFPWYRRIGTYARRGANELNRYWHYAFRDPIWLTSLRYRHRHRLEDFALPVPVLPVSVSPISGREGL